MGRSLSRLAHTRALLDRFVEGNGRRLALVQWGGAKPAIVALFTSRKSVVPKAIASLQPGPPGDLAKDLYGAIDLASRLPWAARARKTIIVLTAASTYSSDAYQNAIEWTYASKVSVLWIDPTRPLTGDW